MKKDIQELIDVFASIDDAKEMKKLFEEILTDREKHDLAMRWRLMKDLKRGKPQRDIAKDLGISLCKITRGSKILKEPKSICSRIISQKIN